MSENEQRVAKRGAVLGRGSGPAIPPPLRAVAGPMTPRERREVTIPACRDSICVLSLPWPMTAKEWRTMIGFLNALEAVVVDGE